MPIIADVPVWRVELTIGTRHGYTGPEVVTPADLIPLVQEYQRGTDAWYAIIVWTRGTVLGPTFPSETVIKVTLENNPIYTPDATAETMMAYAAGLAEFLAERLQQTRIYLALYTIRSFVVEREQ